MGQAGSKQEMFWEACGFGRAHLVEKFIEHGIDVNWVSSIVSILILRYFDFYVILFRNNILNNLCTSTFSFFLFQKTVCLKKICTIVYIIK